jgi:hypothetical protein
MVRPGSLTQSRNHEPRNTTVLGDAGDANSPEIRAKEINGRVVVLLVAVVIGRGVSREFRGREPGPIGGWRVLPRSHCFAGIKVRKLKESSAVILSKI